MRDLDDQLNLLPAFMTKSRFMNLHSLEDLHTRANEFADAFESYDPKPGDQDAPLPPLTTVKLAAWRRHTAEQELADAVRASREQNVSWRELGEALGTSGEAARQRYSASTSPPN